MKTRTKIILLSLVVLIGILSAACPKRVSIADIEANPSRYANKTVAVAGVVQDSYGVNIPLTSIRGGVYKISDGSGSLWILTENSVPGKGAQVGVKGKIQNGLSWNGRNYGLGMMEEDRRFRRTR